MRADGTFAKKSLNLYHVPLIVSVKLRFIWYLTPNTCQHIIGSLLAFACQSV